MHATAHHSSYGYGSMPPGYGQHGQHGHMGMYYHPSLYPFPMVNPAAMGSSHTTSGSGQGAAQNAHATNASTAGAADQSGNAPHYMHYSHPHFFQVPGMMQPGAPGFGSGSSHHQQQQQQHHSAAAAQHHPSQSMNLGAYGTQFAQQPQAQPQHGAAPAAPGARKKATKSTKPRSKKEEVDPMSAAAAVAAAMPMMPMPGAHNRAMVAQPPPVVADIKGKKKKEEPKKEPKKIMRSRLKQPKQAPSAWQLFFTEELNKMRAAKPDERLNVAHVAKGAGERYNSLPEVEKQKYHQRSLELKEQWEKDMQTWKESLSPEDIKQENAFRTQQRKAGKSRKSNLKDPNAPKKPLSAYFLFLRAIRSSAKMTEDIFGKEGETTKQSVLAAEKWKVLNDTEKAPYLQKADQDKARYEEARRVYEEAQKHGVPAHEAAQQADAAGRAAAAKMAEANPLHNLPPGLEGDHHEDDDDRDDEDRK